MQLNLVSLGILVFLPAACITAHIIAHLVDRQDHHYHQHQDDAHRRHGVYAPYVSHFDVRNRSKSRGMTTSNNKVHPETEIASGISSSVHSSTLSPSSLRTTFRESHTWLAILRPHTSNTPDYFTRTRRTTALSINIVTAFAISASFVIGTSGAERLQQTAAGDIVVHTSFIAIVLFFLNNVVLVLFRRAQTAPPWNQMLLYVRHCVRSALRRRHHRRNARHSTDLLLPTDNTASTNSSNNDNNNTDTRLTSSSLEQKRTTDPCSEQDYYETHGNISNTLTAPTETSTSIQKPAAGLSLPITKHIVPRSRVAKKLLLRAEQSMHRKDISSAAYYLRSAARTEPDVFPRLSTDEAAVDFAQKYAAEQLGIDIKSWTPQEFHVRPKNVRYHENEKVRDTGDAEEYVNIGDGTAEHPFNGIEATAKYFGPMVTIVLCPGTFSGFLINQGGESGAELRIVGSGSATLVRGGDNGTGIGIGKGVGHVHVQDMVISHADTGIDARESGSGVCVTGIVFRDVATDIRSHPEHPVHSVGNITANVERTKLRELHRSRIRAIRHAVQRGIRQGRQHAAHPPWYWACTAHVVALGVLVWMVGQTTDILYLSLFTSIIWVVQAIGGMVTDALFVQPVMLFVWIGLKRFVRSC